jgi:hypothetical protein
VSGILGFLFSFVPSPVAEMLIVPAIAAVLFCLVRAALRSVRERTAWPLLLWVSGAAAYTAGIIFGFILLWGGNYFAPELETRLGIGTVQVSEELLYKTAERHLEDALRYSALLTRDESGTAYGGGFDAMASGAVRAMTALGESYPDLLGMEFAYMRTSPRQARMYSTLGKLGIAGIYIPFTGEAVVNPISTDPFLPAVMAHEMAHRLGFAPEEDANMIAYLACMASDEPIFRYSGSIMAFNYCYNALTSREYRIGLRERMGAVAADFRQNHEAWAGYSGPLWERAEGINNAYLQAMGQPEGVLSYGRVADMLIALNNQ